MKSGTVLFALAASLIYPLLFVSIWQEPSISSYYGLLILTPLYVYVVAICCVKLECESE